MRCLAIGLIVVATTLPLAAQTSTVRETTPAEKAKLVDVLKAGGCTTFEVARVVDDIYEIKNARCGGEQLYDIVYDKNLKMISMSEKPKS